MDVKLRRWGPGSYGIRWSLGAALAQTVALQNAVGIRIDQHGEPIAKAAGIEIDQYGAFPLDASAQNAAQAKQRTAPANFTGIAATIADDLAVGAQYRFQQRNRIQNRLPFSGFVHTKPDFKLATNHTLAEVIT